MAVRFRPTTRLGRLAARLALGFLAWFVVNQVLVALVQRYDINGMIFLPLAFLGMAVGLAAGVVALVAMVRQGERGVAAFLCLLPLAFVVSFGLGEILVPH